MQWTQKVDRIACRPVFYAVFILQNVHGLCKIWKVHVILIIISVKSAVGF
jgi:hypothetical protein